MSNAAGTNACIHQLFEVQVQRTPEATAIVHNERRVSYKELNDGANQLAHRLRRMGVAAELPVGVLTDRSVQMVIDVLAVLKAGGAFVPLDHKYPVARLRYIIEDAGVKLLLTCSESADAANALAANLLTLDVQQAGCHESENPVSNTDSQNLAYIIYTSGSTGKPKGVGLTHENAVSFLKWVGQTFTPAELKGVLASTSLCFDLSVFEIFAPLCYGGYFILAENSLALATLPNASEVRLVNCVPSVFSELLEDCGIASSVQTVNLAGEPLSQALLRRINQLRTVRRVLNLYGPTECTTYSTYAEMPRDKDVKPPIGRPIANTRAYVLNESLARVELLTEGELYLAGAGVARGYVNHPDLTAARFLPDPFSREPNQRMYRTGDIVRRLPSGDLEFVGRRDSQVKLRGYRVELGEIESALNSHEQVLDSVVMLRTEPHGEQHLVAYVSSAFGSNIAELRSFLRTRLPEFMVPAKYLVLPKLPLTPNGKLDRKALPYAVDVKRETSVIVPRTPEEAKIAKTFADVLQLPAVSVTDNFFDLGGSSLSAFRITARLRETFQLELEPHVLFDSPTVASLAQKIRQAGRRRNAATEEKLRSEVRTNRSPLSFAQQRFYFLEKIQIGDPVYNVCAAVHINGTLDRFILGRTLDEIVRRHESLRTCFPSHDDLPFQHVRPAGKVPLPSVDLRLADQAKEVQRIALKELDRFFDLVTGPLMRAQLLCLNEEEHVLLLTTHHIVFDDWSMNVLLRELQSIYEAMMAGSHPPLPELASQYSDYAVWQRRWMRGERLEKQLSYWREQLSNLPPTLEWPTSNRRPTSTQHGAQEVLAIDSTLWDAVHLLSRRLQVTNFMTLLAAFDVLTYTYTLREDLLVGTISAGRDEPLTEPLIGCFINTLILRTRMTGNPTFEELLVRVRRAGLDAYANQGAPFEKIVDELRRSRPNKDEPAPQIFFGVRNARLPALKKRSSRPSFSEYEIPIRSARFDLTVWIDEHGPDRRASWTYATRLFSSETIRKMHQRYLAILRFAVSDPGLSLRELLAACVKIETPLAKQSGSAFSRKPARSVTITRS
jgi:amino acid adenylation domain-containing protein